MVFKFAITVKCECLAMIAINNHPIPWVDDQQIM